MRRLSCKVGYEILHVSNDEITPVTEMDYEGNRKLVIFDDYVCDKNGIVYLSSYELELSKS